MDIEHVNSMVNCRVSDGFEITVVSANTLPIFNSLPSDEFFEYWQIFDNKSMELIVSRESLHTMVFISSAYASVLPAHSYVLPPNFGSLDDIEEFDPYFALNEASKHLGLNANESVSKVNFFGLKNSKITQCTPPSDNWKWTL